MKDFIGQLLLIASFAAISFIVPFTLVQKQNVINAQQLTSSKQVLGIEGENASQGLPARLIIPAINVNASIQSVGVSPDGEMEVPSNTTDAGWFKIGVRPGQRGSAVIAGHLNGKNGEAGVFTNLNKLKKGDKFFTEDYKGMITTFTVRESRIYNPGYADEVFSNNDIAHLNLVTCDGVWEGNIKSYSKRLVVFSDIAL